MSSENKPVMPPERIEETETEEEIRREEAADLSGQFVSNSVQGRLMQGYGSLISC